MNVIDVSLAPLEDIQVSAQAKIDTLSEKIGRYRQMIKLDSDLSEETQEVLLADAQKLWETVEMYKALLRQLKYACRRYRENEDTLDMIVLGMEVENG